MSKVRKTEFLIVRVEPDLKKRIVQEAERAEISISKFLRELMDKI